MMDGQTVFLNLEGEEIPEEEIEEQDEHQDPEEE